MDILGLFCGGGGEETLREAFPPVFTYDPEWEAVTLFIVEGRFELYRMARSSLN